MSTIEMPQAEAAGNGLVFRDLALSEEVQLAVQMSGYISPTPIQSEIIPHMLEGRDVLAQSQTGTGKTAAFALPILSRIDIDGAMPQVLVLAPTRELATQVAKSFETYGSCMSKLKIAAIYGGADYDPQLRLLKRGVHIVVGTPGRVIDHIRRGTLKLDNLRCLVLDEADEMLNMGFLEDVEFVLDQSPKEKQVALFSATLPGPIRKIADQHLENPASITIKRKTLTADSIQQRCVFVEDRDKLALLASLLELEDTDGVIVFTKTKDSTMVVADKLVELGLKAAALNGDLPQARRQRTVDQLKSGQLDILVATDVAARGLDVQRISHVFNYDLPHDSESYIHRIGRTGRAGRSGVAVIFLTFRQRGKLRLIENATKQAIQVIDPPTASEINQARIQRFREQIVKAAASPDLALYQKIISDHVQESGSPIELIAAALAHMAQGGRPLLVKDVPRRARTERSYDDRAPRGRERDGRERDNRGRDGRPEARRPRQPLGRPQQGMERYWIGVGRSDGVNPGNIVGAVANEAGIAGGDIGPINIGETFSTVDLPAGLPGELLSTLQRTWVSGKQLKIRLFTERRGSESEAPARSPSAKPPRKPAKPISRRSEADGPRPTSDGPRTKSADPARRGKKKFANQDSPAFAKLIGGEIGQKKHKKKREKPLGKKQRKSK